METQLVAACTTGDLKEVKRLLPVCDPNYCEEFWIDECPLGGEPAMSFAIMNGHVDIVVALLDDPRTTVHLYMIEWGTNTLPDAVLERLVMRATPSIGIPHILCDAKRVDVLRRYLSGQGGLVTDPEFANLIPLKIRLRRRDRVGLLAAREFSAVLQDAFLAIVDYL